MSITVSRFLIAKKQKNDITKTNWDDRFLQQNENKKFTKQKNTENYIYFLKREKANNWFNFFGSNFDKNREHSSQRSALSRDISKSTRKVTFHPYTPYSLEIHQIKLWEPGIETYQL